MYTILDKIPLLFKNRSETRSFASLMKAGQKSITVPLASWTFILLMIAGIVLNTLDNSKVESLRQQTYLNTRLKRTFLLTKVATQSIINSEQVNPSFVSGILKDTNFNFFQFRQISEYGEEVVKIDEYGDNNKNTITSREYWKDINSLHAKEWHVTPVTENFENDSISGEAIATGALTLRLFYKSDRKINDLNNSFLVFNVDVGREIEVMKKLYPFLKIEPVNSEPSRDFTQSITQIRHDFDITLEIDDQQFLLAKGYSYLNIQFEIFTILLLVSLGVLGHFIWAKFMEQQKFKLKQEEEGRLFTSKWLNMASHYFRHPIANISTNLEILQLKGLLKINQPETTKIMGSLDEFLSIFSHLQKSVKLNEIDSQSKDWITVKALTRSIMNNQSRKVSTILYCDPELLIHANVELLSWVFIELVENAYIHGNSKNVSVSISQKVDGLSIYVEDDGMGMNSKLMRDLNSGAIKFKSDGFEKGQFGLGYSQIIKILEFHDFSISLSKRPIKGTEVKIVISRKYVSQQDPKVAKEDHLEGAI